MTRMISNYKTEFKTVEILLKSDFETRAIDAFSISLIKVERQIRRIFTFLIYQSDSYKKGDGIRLRKILADNKKIYLKHFIKGIDTVYPKTVEQIYGNKYSQDLKMIEEITKDRNKIFHGQVTDKRLSRKDLIDRVKLMEKWCENMAQKFLIEIGYDGFGRNAYRKSSAKLNLINSDKFDTFEKYADFLKKISRR